MADEGEGKDGLNEYYQYDFSKMRIDVSHQSYSNVAWINVTKMDVFIDFMAFPGVHHDGIPVINATRIHMPLASAARLSEVLGRTIAKVGSKDDPEPVKDERE